MNSMEGTSCERQEDGDDSSIFERPHKKARFSWQIKGKQHLKNEILTSSNDCIKTSELGETSATLVTDEDHKGNTENPSRLEDSLLKQECKSLETDNEDRLDLSWPPRYIRSIDAFPDNSIAGLIVQGPQCIYNGYDSELMESYRSNPPLLEDECISRWQARQFAMVFVENTTNHFLDSWSFPRETDFSTTVDNNVENEGILMAISAHGLQSASSSSSCSYSENQNEEPSTDVNVSLKPQSSVNDYDSTETQRNADITETYTHYRMNMQESESYSVSPIFPDSSSSSLNNSNIFQPEIYEDDIVPTDFAMNDFNSSFINAAVSYAIQNKGLTSKIDFG